MADATDDFNRANGGLGTNWTNVIQAPQIQTNLVMAQNNDADSSAYWNANTFPSNQYGQVRIAVAGLFGDGGGPAVRVQAGAATYYFFFGDNTGCYMLESTAGSFTQLGATYVNVFIANDVAKLDATGSTLTPSINGGALATRTDSSITGGNPGLHIFDQDLIRLDDWLGGPIDVAGGGLGALLSNKRSRLISAGLTIS